jgi:hypothetical protein
VHDVEHLPITVKPFTPERHACHPHDGGICHLKSP